MSITPEMKEVLRRCKGSVSFFINNFCKIKHPSIGVIPFHLFKYQQNCLKDFREHRFNCFKKCRQSGISTLCGAYALWLTMFHNEKTVLIVSKTDEDAKTFLNRNIKFLHDHLPIWMKDIWVAPINNEHQFGFANGSAIKSLTSAPNTLRSNASSLNIIDEAAFIKDMEAMWGAGFSTLQHGGHTIVVSTPCGIGNWYWRTWNDATEGYNDFNPIEIRWWDMDWHLEYTDAVTRKKMRIAPTEDIKKCTTNDMINKYGPYWSPWLEGEYRGLQSRGEGYLFKQEVLAEFLGSGNTVLEPEVIRKIQKDADESPEPQLVTEIVQAHNDITGEIDLIDFNGENKNEGLYIWEVPVLPTPPQTRGDRTIAPGTPGHTYVMGVDVATGQNNDYSTIVVLDTTTREQVAEYMGRTLCIPFSKIVNYLGRWYNNALVIIESTGIGNPFIQSVETLAYPNLWRQKRKVRGGIAYGAIGFPTGPSGKPALNKALIDNLSAEDGQGYAIRSNRLAFQFNTYIRKRNSRGYDTTRTEAQEGNYDDLVMACALALHAAQDAMPIEPLLPMNNENFISPNLGMLSVDQQMQMNMDSFKNANDPGFMMPVQGADRDTTFLTPEEELEMFTAQLGTKVDPRAIVSVVKKDYFAYNKRQK